MCTHVHYILCSAQDPEKFYVGSHIVKTLGTVHFDTQNEDDVNYSCSCGNTNLNENMTIAVEIAI